MSKYYQIEKKLKDNPKTWLITGVAGFIGSNLLERLLEINQNVVGLDNFSTGHESNLVEVKSNVNESVWNNFNFIKGDINIYEDCKKSLEGVDYVLHQAALGSVPRSIKNPIKSNEVNISGFLNILQASKEKNVKSFVYASSSSVYGDNNTLPKVENNIGKPLSPYAFTKLANEIYAEIFSKIYDFSSIGLRYFNVFGRRQNPDGEYAAVIPKWISAMINQDEVNIFGDGLTSRDFCYIENVIQINILSATAAIKKNKVYNVAFGEQTSLNELFEIIKHALLSNSKSVKTKPCYLDFRPGDVRHSLAQITKATSELGYNPEFNIRQGIEDAMPWYIDYLK